MDKKGYYFTMDVIFAVLIIVAGSILIINNYLTTQIAIPTITSSRDIGDFLTNTKLLSLNDEARYPYAYGVINDLKENASDKSMAEVTAILYSDPEKMPELKNLLNESVDSIKQPHKNVQILIDGNEIVLINTTSIPSSPQVSVDKRLIFYGNEELIDGPYKMTIIVWV